MDKNSIAVIIPSYEPTQKLPDLLKKIRKIFNNTIVVVDDGSNKDAYQKFFEEAAKNANVVILRHKTNKGKGCALKTAFTYCLENNFQGAVTADSDGQHLPEDISHCIESLVEHPESLVLGVRDFSQKNIPFKSKFGNVLTCTVFRCLVGRALSDTQTGLRGISANFMKDLVNLPGDRFEYETKMLWFAKENNIPYKEVKIATVYENGNSGTHFRPIRDSWLIYKTLINDIFSQFLFFVGSGIVSFLVDLGLFSLLFYVLFSGLSIGRLIFSVVLARCISSFTNYMINRNIVFKYKKKKYDTRTFSAYVILCIVIMFLSYFLTRFSIKLFPERNVAFLKIIGDFILFFISFTMQKYFIFNQNKK